MSLICPFLGFMKSVIKRSTKKCFFLIPLLFVFLTNTQYSSIIPQHNGNRFVCGTVFECEMEKISEGRSYSQNNITISDCFFIRSSEYYYDGGVIYVSASSCSMNVNYSMFYNCVSSKDGGAIYFSSSNSYLRMICANSCSCGDYSNFHFAYLSASQVNQVEYLSVSKCSHTTYGYYSICLDTGNQRVDNTNSSMNNANHVSGIDIISKSSFTSSHCTFSNNKVSDSRCIRFYDSGTISMSYANIVHNNSPSHYGVVYVSGSHPKMMYCIFKNNQNTLFCVYGGSLEVSHSFIDHSAPSFSTYIAVSTSNNNSFIITQTYMINYSGELICKIPEPSYLIWIILSIAFILILSLLVLLYFYRMNVSILLSNLVDDSDIASPGSITLSIV